MPSIEVIYRSKVHFSLLLNVLASFFQVPICQVFLGQGETPANDKQKLELRVSVPIYFFGHNSIPFRITDKGGIKLEGIRMFSNSCSDKNSTNLMN